ncbi:RNA-directed DNA polymerase from mobile element jockey-like [Plakobranchus ocellatus]|uniref:RNA-directed DNA polymerase from mobile element jockey-like n=1 Tax=Plakobranchus ocellatus TaxID=259542 RepID=A0AAV4CZM1_9GAST|nr:RNA-directed DNA polymerase from mobile element jockey-like [Plakobranchus ocellatus]
MAQKEQRQSDVKSEAKGADRQTIRGRKASTKRRKSRKTEGLTEESRWATTEKEAYEVGICKPDGCDLEGRRRSAEHTHLSCVTSTIIVAVAVMISRTCVWSVFPKRGHRPSPRSSKRRGRSKDDRDTTPACRLLHGKDSPQQGDLKFSDTPPGKGAGGGVRTHDRKALADLKIGSHPTLPATLLMLIMRKSIRPETFPKHFGFMSDKGARNAIFTLSMLMERCIEMQKDLHLCFIDYSKAFDKRVLNEGASSCLDLLGMEKETDGWKLVVGRQEKIRVGYSWERVGFYLKCYGRFRALVMDR